MLEPFRTNISTLRRTISADSGNKIKEITWDNFSEVAGQSDFIINVLPFTPETEGNKKIIFLV